MDLNHQEKKTALLYLMQSNQRSPFQRKVLSAPDDSYVIDGSEEEPEVASSESFEDINVNQVRNTNKLDLTLSEYS